MDICTKRYSLVSMRAESCGLVILLTVDICRVVECLVPPPHGAPPLLVLEVPVEAGEGSVLLALVLQVQGSLLHSELLQVPSEKIEKY